MTKKFSIYGTAILRSRLVVRNTVAALTRKFPRAAFFFKGRNKKKKEDSRRLRFAHKLSKKKSDFILYIFWPV